MAILRPTQSHVSIAGILGAIVPPLWWHPRLSVVPCPVVVKRSIIVVGERIRRVEVKPMQTPWISIVYFVVAAVFGALGQ